MRSHNLSWNPWLQITIKVLVTQGHTQQLRNAQNYFSSTNSIIMYISLRTFYVLQLCMHCSFNSGLKKYTNFMWLNTISEFLYVIRRVLINWIKMVINICFANFFCFQERNWIWWKQWASTPNCEGEQKWHSFVLPERHLIVSFQCFIL